MEHGTTAPAAEVVQNCMEAGITVEVHEIAAFAHHIPLEQFQLFARAEQ